MNQVQHEPGIADLKPVVGVYPQQRGLVVIILLILLLLGRI